MAHALRRFGMTLLLLGMTARADALCVGGQPNGQLDVGELCDDGNLGNRDCCLSDCTNPCDDEKACTDDVCSINSNGRRKCTSNRLPDDSPCGPGLDGDDGDACTLDVCADHRCTHRPLGDAACDDANPCTVDACDPTTACSNLPTNEGQACNDHNSCTFQTRCVAGICGGGVCDVGAPCIESTSCQSACQATDTGCFCQLSAP